MESLTDNELRHALAFYRKGPLCNKQCQALIQEVEDEMRKRSLPIEPSDEVIALTPTF